MVVVFIVNGFGGVCNVVLVGFLGGGKIIFIGVFLVVVKVLFRLGLVIEGIMVCDFDEVEIW